MRARRQRWTTVPSSSTAPHRPRSPSSSRPPPLFIGLGLTASLTELSVEWPTGVVQRFSGLAVGRHHRLEEPPAFRIVPESRHLPADGTSRVELVLMPRDETGRLLRGEAPEVRLTGSGTIAGEAAWQDDGWHLAVIAPVTPGESRVTISFGAQRLKVRPRLLWEAPR